MNRYIVDCETNGLLPELNKIHSLVLRDIDTGDVISCADQEGYEPICNGIHILENADLLVGHNIINFDFRAIHKVFPSFRLKKKCLLNDTLITSRSTKVFSYTLEIYR